MSSRQVLLVAAGVLSILLAVGCAPALSNMQPAHVAKRNHVQVGLGADVSVPTGSILGAIEAGRLLSTAAQERELTDEEVQTLYEASASLTLNPPSAVSHLGIGYTVLDDLEVGLRYSTNALRLSGRYQFLHRERHGVDATIGLGAARYVQKLPVGDTLKVVELEDFERWQFDVPLVFGTSGDWYRVWGGPRFIYTRFGTALKLTLPEIPGVSIGRAELATLGGSGLYVGAQGGVAFGYKNVFIGFELTLVELFMRGSLEVIGNPGVSLNQDSFIIYPSIGLMGEL